MGDISVVPKILYDLLDQAEALEGLTPEIMWEYLATLNEDESFIPDLVAIVGPSTFALLVKHLSGQAFRVPKPEDILRKVKRARKLAVEAGCAVSEEMNV
jgi:hypothetical protein